MGQYALEIKLLVTFRVFHLAFSHENMDFRTDLFSENALVTAVAGMMIEPEGRE